MNISGENIRMSAAANRSRESVVASLMAKALAKPGILSLAAGFTDNTVLPATLVREAVRNIPENASALQYGSNQGRPALRRSLAEKLRALDGAKIATVDAAGIVMTNGSQQSLYLLAQVLCDEGDIVFVEAPTYFVVFDVLSGLGIEAMSLPMDARGQVDPELLRELLCRLRGEGRLNRVKMAYFITYYSNPGGVSMESGVKRELGKVFSEIAPWVVAVEDTAYRELYFSSPHPAQSILALPEWKGLPVALTGSFSKCFSPGIRLGYFATNVPKIVEKSLNIKAQQDFGSANLSQWIAEYAFASGKFDTLVAGLRMHYAGKARALSDELAFGGLRKTGWKWNDPDGGLLMWLRGPEGLNTGADGDFCRECIDREVLYVPGAICYADPESAPKGNVRLSFGTLPAKDLREGARRFCAAAKACK
jgi:2-aminoadipate transaminase